MVGALIKKLQEGLKEFTKKDPVFGLCLWHYVTVSLLFITGWGLTFLVFSLVEKNFSKKRKKVMGFGTIKHYTSVIGGFMLLDYSLALLDFPIDNYWLQSLIWFFRFVTLVLALLLVNPSVNCIFTMVSEKAKQDNWDKIGFIRVLKVLLKAVLWVFVLFSISGTLLLYDLTPSWLKGLSIGFGTLAAIVAFASQDLIAKLFASLVIAISRPFRIGDWIVVQGGGMEGRVEHIGIRCTQLLTREGRIMYIPNNVFINTTIQNFGPGFYEKVIVKVGFRAGKLEGFNTFIDSVRAMLAAHPFFLPGRCSLGMRDVDYFKTELTLHLFMDSCEERDKIMHIHALKEQIFLLAEQSEITLEA